MKISDKINFCQIAPTNHLNEFGHYNNVHLMLAHLVESDPVYADWYANNTDEKILDNSAFEMYKQGREMYDPGKLLSMAQRTKAGVIIMSDYPGQHSSVTIAASLDQAPQYRDAGFKTFFVPQSNIGDMKDYMHAFEYAINSPHIDYVGVSILGVPNAFGHIEKDNKLQRFLSRWKLMTMLDDAGYLEPFRSGEKRMHFLGALDGWVGEAELVSPYADVIYSWDSSQCVWHGLSGISFDYSPTGLINGKFEEEVDFNVLIEDPRLVELAHNNIKRLLSTELRDPNV
jgi:hypothetical protein